MKNQILKIKDDASCASTLKNISNLPLKVLYYVNEYNISLNRS